MICLNPSIKAPDYMSLNVAATGATPRMHSRSSSYLKYSTALVIFSAGPPPTQPGERAGETRWGNQINESEVRLGGRLSVAEKKTRKIKYKARKWAGGNQPLLLSVMVFLGLKGKE